MASASKRWITSAGISASPLPADCDVPRDRVDGLLASQIAREFQKKDHTTVMYARDKVKNHMAVDEAYRNKVRSLLALCQAD